MQEALLEVSEMRPKDPIDFLAQILYQKSYDIWYYTFSHYILYSLLILLLILLLLLLLLLLFYKD